MPKFLTIGYGNKDGYDRTPKIILERAHAQDARLVADGAVVGVAGDAVQVRNPEGKGVEVTNGPFLRSDLPVAGFAIFDASDLADAVAKVGTVPCAVAYGVVEVWPLGDGI